MDEEKSKKRYDLMTGKPIPSLIMQMAFPSIIGMLITAAYNIADTAFVAKLGTAESGAVGIVFSLMNVIQAAGLTFGIGASSYISRLLGEKKQERASRTASTAFFISIILGALVAVFGLIFITPLVYTLGATDAIMPFARDYAFYILIGAPFMSASFVINHSLRAEGSAMMSMVGMTAGGVLNIILDPIFIYVLDLGVAGAAIATMISQIIGFLILLSNFVFKKSLVRLSPRLVTLEKTLLAEIFKIGSPTFLRLALTSVAMILLNRLAAFYGDSAIAAISIVTKVMIFLVSVIIGFGQGFQPVAGFNYSAGRYDRVWKAFWFSSVSSMAGMLILSAVTAVFSRRIMLFLQPENFDPDVVRIGTASMIAQSLVMPLNSFVIMVNMLYQALGRAGASAMLSLSRQGICLIPALFILDRLFNVMGLASAQAVADFMSVLIAVPLAVVILRRISNLMRVQKLSQAPHSEPA